MFLIARDVRLTKPNKTVGEINKRFSDQIQILLTFCHFLCVSYKIEHISVKRTSFNMKGIKRHHYIHQNGLIEFPGLAN